MPSSPWCGSFAKSATTIGGFHDAVLAWELREVERLTKN